MRAEEQVCLNRMTVPGGSCVVADSDVDSDMFSFINRLRFGVNKSAT